MEHRLLWSCCCRSGCGRQSGELSLRRFRLCWDNRPPGEGFTVEVSGKVSRHHSHRLAMGMRWRRLPDRLSIAVPSPAISSRPTDRAVSSRARSFGVRGQSGRSHFVGVSPNVEEATEGVPRRGPAHRPLSSGRPARGLRASPHWVSLLTPGCFQTQLSDLDLARAFPQTTIVLNHCGEPLAVGPYAGKREGG